MTEEGVGCDDWLDIILLPTLVTAIGVEVTDIEYVKSRGELRLGPPKNETLRARSR